MNISEVLHNLYCRRTLTAVHDAMLEDLAFPAEIVGKRIRIKLDGSRLIKVHLDKNQQTNIEHKVRARICMYCCPIYQFSVLDRSVRMLPF